MAKKPNKIVMADTVKAAMRPAQSSKQIGHEVLPSRFAKASIVNGHPVTRSINQYAKAAPGPVELGPMGLMSMARR